MTLQNLVVHGEMLLDDARNRALARAIEHVVQPGDVVADIGAGTGLLALAAARAGAKQVYAIERGPMALVARSLVGRNNAEDVIHVTQKDSRDFEPPQRVDVAICETLGMACLDEGLRATIADARDRLLKPGGRLVPSSVGIMVAPVGNSEEGSRLDRLETVLGFDFVPFADLVRRVHRRAYFDDEDLIAPGKLVWDLDCSTLRPEEELCAPIAFTAADDCVLGGYVLWFEARLAPNINLSNWGRAPANHWGQAYLPVPARRVSADTELRVRLSIRDQPGRFRIEWTEQEGTTR